MEHPIIEIKNIGKEYTIRHERNGYLSLRDLITELSRRFLRSLRGKKEDRTRESFWALKNVTCSIKKGEIIGIIGSNGAGKSTLLKILSQITPPTTGEIKIHGSVGSLLEVGTGFHPELSGRENIFFNGAIMGMGKKEIAQKFDRIVEFAGVEKFLDTPVKHYSSGMFVRLAFSVAAHLEPDVLIIDEVLAVGDEEFQRQCLKKMKDLAANDHRTILFISHNMEAIKDLCKHCILLEKGQIASIGKTDEVIGEYLAKHRI